MISFRPDRLLTIYLFSTFISKKQSPGKSRIPILMYHSISGDRERELNPYYHINTSRATFDAHMRYLNENNYSVINLENIEECLNAGNRSKFVIITFDDGFQDFYTMAFPVINNYHFTATVFLPSGLINNTNNNRKIRGKEHLNWREVRELSRYGIIFGSHSVTHSRLELMTKKEIECEISKSKETIEEKTGKAVHSFSYPLSFPEEQKSFTEYFKKILEKYTYRNGVTTRIGLARQSDDIHFLRRIPLNSNDDSSFFKAKLEGGYDWLYWPQYFYKLLKKI